MAAVNAWISPQVAAVHHAIGYGDRARAVARGVNSTRPGELFADAAEELVPVRQPESSGSSRSSR